MDANGQTSPSIMQFACHCDTTDADSDNHNIDVGVDIGLQHATVDLGALKTYFYDVKLPSTHDRPLMFLNACGSVAAGLRVCGHCVVDFVRRLFARQDYAGIIGPLCDISDPVAAHYATVFYEHLLTGRTIGEAMYDARWHLMERHGNPLGILYSFYGNPDLRVSHPQAGRVIPACTQPRPYSSVTLIA